MKNDIPAIPVGFTLITDLPVAGVYSRSQLRVLYNIDGQMLEYERWLPKLEPDNESYLIRTALLDLTFMLERMGLKTRSIQPKLFASRLRRWIRKL